jgi:hypothetical protein
LYRNTGDRHEDEDGEGSGDTNNVIDGEDMDIDNVGWLMCISICIHQASSSRYLVHPFPQKTWLRSRAGTYFIGRREPDADYMDY